MDADRPGGRIGRTPLFRADRLGRDLRAGELLLKLESANPSHVQKDRAAAAMVEAARAGGFQAISVGSCGNLGVSLARAAARAGVRACVFVPDRYRSTRLEEIEAAGATVERTAGGYEEAVMASARHARHHGLYDANPSGPGGAASLEAYRQIAVEILETLSGWPDTIWVAVGNGTTLAGIGRGAVSGERGTPGPRLCGAGSAGNTAAIRSILAGEVVELDPGSLVETPTNEPLLNWRSFHAREALEMVRATGGIGYEASDLEMETMAKLLLDREGIFSIPAACAALCGLAQTLESGLVRPGRHVVVLTG